MREDRGSLLVLVLRLVKEEPWPLPVSMVGPCSAAEVVSGCGVVVRKGVISHHFRALKKVERPRTAHFRTCLRCRGARFKLLVALWCAQACWALLEVAVQLVSQLLFDHVLNWLWAGVCLYKAGHCGNDGGRPVQWVHDVILAAYRKGSIEGRCVY